MTGRPRDKVVVVTGGASGIGAAVAERFVADGAQVVVADLDASQAAHTARALGDTCTATAVDMADEGAVEALFAATMDRFGRVDVLVNNAGIIHVAPLTDMDLAAWQRVMDVNATGTFLGCRAAARAMMSGGQGGVIINASSGAGRRGVANLAAYCASKAAVIMLTQSLAIELAPHGIRVNCVTPGHIETPFWQHIAAGFAAATGQPEDAVIAGFRDSVPAGRFGRPEEVAAAVAWLASDEAAYVSGESVAINGAEFPF